MTTTTAAQQAVTEAFDGPWRDDSPVFSCCRKAAHAAADAALVDIATLGPIERVQALRSEVEAQLPGHLDAHRCCRIHTADLAFDLPRLLSGDEPAD